MAWSAGDRIVWRTRVRITADAPEGELGVASPQVLVRDRPDEVAVYLAPGTVAKLRDSEKEGPRGRVVSRVLDSYRDDVWRRWRRLTIRRPADAHQVSLFWDAAGDRFHWWYVDFVSPLRRTRLGFDSVDHGIDLIVEPDMSSWLWKDAEELDWYVEHRRYSPAEADAIRAEGLRAVDSLRRDHERWERWTLWRPDPSWAVPELPAGWDEPL
jgi:hypothetical protein